jgi:carbamoyltransferase
MRILGISCFYHDAAACLLENGEIVAAAQEERFTRKKHDQQFPGNAVRYCLAEAGDRDGDVDAVAFYDKPILSSTASWRPIWRRRRAEFAPS